MHEDAVHNNIKHQCYLHVNETDPEGDRHDDLGDSTEGMERVETKYFHVPNSKLPGSGTQESNDLDRLNMIGEAGTVKLSLHVLGNSINSELPGSGHENQMIWIDLI